jgi:hypothetical protein
MQIEIIEQERIYKSSFGAIESSEDFEKRVNERINLYTIDMEVVDINFLIQDGLILAIIKIKYKY